MQNDAVAALASGTAGRLYGCVVVAGTGTIALGFGEDGKFARASGVGPLLGDQGRSVQVHVVPLAREIYSKLKVPMKRLSTSYLVNLRCHRCRIFSFCVHEKMFAPLELMDARPMRAAHLTSPYWLFVICIKTSWILGTFL